jgi:hypothetical protein
LNNEIFRGLQSIVALSTAILFRRIKPGPVGQVRDKWFCLGGLGIKTQTPSTKIFQLFNAISTK